MKKGSTKLSLHKGIEVIRGYVRIIPTSAGVYRMLDCNKEVLYVGKAKNLQKRVASYTQENRLSDRFQRMVAQTVGMDFITTHSEVEALLLEANLIKKWKPPFNVLLKDDKSYAYIVFSPHKTPQLMKYRGVREKGQTYYGPFASTQALEQMLLILQRTFQLRTCRDSDFAKRTRPCLKYHIKQCSAPCVGYIQDKAYQESIKQAQNFLKGKNHEVRKYLLKRMEKASQDENYEQAAILRDQLKAITHIHAEQRIHIATLHDVDVIGAVRQGKKVCFQFFIYRNGINLGNMPIILDSDKEDSFAEIISKVLMQFYQSHEPPPLILLSDKPNEPQLVQSALSQLREGNCVLEYPKRFEKKRLIDMAVHNAKEALTRSMITQSATQAHLVQLKELFELDRIPQRIEIYDNSHLQGAYPLGVIVVATPEGFDKKSYRRFHIRSQSLEPGDDYGMMREVMQRRFQGTTKTAPDPDVLLIDGGKGQLSTVLKTLKLLDKDFIKVIAIAKGPDRNAGRETFFMENRAPLQLDSHDPVLFYLQRLRDEAHRFAITGNRQRREGGAFKSKLDSIPGVGAKRKKDLLHFFGSVKAMSQAGIEDLQKVKGVSAKLAKIIYDGLHEG